MALRAYQVSDPIVTTAHQFDTQLREQVMPYWFDRAQDLTYGGYSLEAGSKTLLSQSRMIWGFSHAHRLGYSTAERNYLTAAAQGVQFVFKRFRDRANGGYYWKTASDGRVIDSRKLTLGHAFLLFALVEHYRASKDPKILAAAMRVFETLQTRARDQSAGWLELFTETWQPVYSGKSEPQIGFPGLKSANAHLHMMEALSELYAETKAPDVRAALEEAVRVNQSYFFPADPDRAVSAYSAEWKSQPLAATQTVNYGHNVEFAWLLLRAQEALGVSPSYALLNNYVQHALDRGFDHTNGGLYLRGTKADGVTDAEKVWWPQAELLAALTYALRLDGGDTFRPAARKELEFITHTLVDPNDGIWSWSLKADGKLNSLKSSNWKANYHDVRAMSMWVEAFGMSKASREHS